ncbi:porin family protein [Hymenobacter crusticola]|uniref:Outer membrane protein beta-barrel domain-containing protein n=1 Tax=Hymenobacter crusticola TaxID=1770526 RepID=A0A243WDY2_9BACT|nr:porin family protein [Hymenobacter crusticola]OUJ73812.1 hypothetical protein BXP70_12610 [Hymenobacter crusticola]
MQKLVFTIFLAASVSTTMAQQVHLGIKAGPSYTKLNGVDHAQITSASNAYRVGFHGGVTAEASIINKLSLEAELLYSQKGAQNKIAPKIKTIFSYLDLPILAKISTGSTGAFFEAGPQFGYTIQVVSKWYGTRYKERDLYEKFDIGYVAGLGYQLASGPRIGFRYNGGITRMNKPAISDGKIYATEDMRNNAFQLYVGYVFGKRQAVQ